MMLVLPWCWYTIMWVWVPPAGLLLYVLEGTCRYVPSTCMFSLDFSSIWSSPWIWLVLWEVVLKFVDLPSCIGMSLCAVLRVDIWSVEMVMSGPAISMLPMLAKMSRRIRSAFSSSLILAPWSLRKIMLLHYVNGNVSLSGKIGVDISRWVLAQNVSCTELHGYYALNLLWSPLISSCHFHDEPINRRSSWFCRYISTVMVARCSVIGGAISGQVQVLARHHAVLCKMSTGPRVEMILLRSSGCA